LVGFGPVRIVFIIPGDINLPTGGFRYDRSIIQEWQALGHKIDLICLTGSYPLPSSEELAADLDAINNIPAADIAVVDGLAGGAHPQLLEMLSRLMPVVALVHHPLCLETGLDADTSEKLKHSEAAGLAHVSGIVTTSRQTARTVSELFAISDTPLQFIEPGVKRGGFSEPSDKGPVQLLCVGSVIERKGHDILTLALKGLRDLDWHLDCIGKTDLQPDHFSKVTSLVKDCGLTDRISFKGAVSATELKQVYNSAHVFVLPSLYEGYGMVFAEAIASGLPVIGTLAGAIPDTVPPGCGVLVPPGDVEALAQALETMISNPDRRQAFRIAAMNAADSFPTWHDSARKFSEFLEQFA